MGKPIIAQKRGKGSTAYSAPSFKFKGSNCMLSQGDAVIVDIVHCRAHSAPMVVVESVVTGQRGIVVAAEGLRVGDTVNFSSSETKLGHAVALGNIPEGALVYNIENSPGDGGKFVRSSGASAKVLSKSEKGITIVLPSKKRKVFNPKCRACIGVVAGGGRVEKPFLKAGVRAMEMKKKNRVYPKVSAGAMNAVDHPFGNKRSSRKSKARVAPRNAPPGRKVGMVRASRTGRKVGKSK